MHRIHPTTRLQRELTDEQVEHQAEQLASYVRRGGSPSHLLNSKDIMPGDRAAIVVAYADLDEDEALR